MAGAPMNVLCSQKYGRKNVRGGRCLHFSGLLRPAPQDMGKLMKCSIVFMPHQKHALYGVLGGWSFQGKEILPLQAADVMAYEVYKHVENQIVDKGEKYDVRRSMIDLYRPRDDNYLKLWSRERLIDWVNSATLRGKPLKDYR